MSENGSQVLAVGIDYLTCTFTNMKLAGQAAALSSRLAMAELSAGNFRHPWGMAGFVGFQVGSIQVGQRNKDLLVRLSAHLAHDRWRQFYARSSTTSRIDLQVTSRTLELPERRIIRHYREANRKWRTMKHGPAVALYTTSERASTVYLGMRSSERYGRVYNKGAESKMDHWANAVRYEVELKGDQAEMMAGRLFKESDASLLIRWHVHQFFSDRGCKPGFAPGPGESSTRPPAGVSHLSSVEVEPLHPGYPEPGAVPPPLTDVRRKLRWLSKSVRPFAMLCVHQGRGDELLAALGVAIDGPGGLTVDGPGGPLNHQS